MSSSKSVRFAVGNANTSREFTLADETRELYTHRSEHEANCRKLFEDSKRYESQKYGGRYLNSIYDLPFQEQIQCLVSLHHEAEAARGLEQHICDDHKAVRGFMRSSVIDGVLNQQHSLLKAPMTCEERAERMASLSEENSYQARVFARVVALADEYVVKEVNGIPITDDDLAFVSASRGNVQKRTSSGKLAKMMKRAIIGRSNSKVGSSKSFKGKASRRHSPRTSATDDFGEQFERYVSLQERT